jgi:hypothetical protein
MKRIRAFVIEVHRRSLWQVLAVYLAASWFVLQVSEHVVERFLLPEWVYGAAFLLLLLGLPIVLATAMVREEPASRRSRDHTGNRAPPTPAGSGGPSPGTSSATASHSPADSGAGVVQAPDRPASTFWTSANRRLRASPLRFLLTWPRAIAGGSAAFALLSVVGGLFYVQGLPRITEARGSAGDAFPERSWILVADFEAAGEEDRTVAWRPAKRSPSTSNSRST